MSSILRRQFVSPAIWTLCKWNICLATMRSWVHACMCVCVCVRAHFMWTGPFPLLINTFLITVTCELYTCSKAHWRGRLVTGIGTDQSRVRSQSYPESVHVGFMVDEMTLGQVYLWVFFRFPFGSVYHCTMLFDLCHRCYIILIIT